MKFEIATISKQGGRYRNEDACGYWTSDGGSCWIVSDGAGGHSGGDVASRTVVSSILHDFASDPEVSPGAICDVLKHANDAVLQEQIRKPDLSDMRATAAILMIDQKTQGVLWGHLGDSRVYCFRHRRLFSQTRDHSLMQSMVDAGYGDVSILRGHPGRSVLLQALGSTDEMAPTVLPTLMPVQQDDAFLLCSDGWWDYVDEAAMERELIAAQTPEAWLTRLEAELLSRAKPDHDNYTAVAVWVSEVDESTRILPASSAAPAQGG